MTNKEHSSDAPEKIYLHGCPPQEPKLLAHWSPVDRPHPYWVNHEYIRADVVDALRAENERLKAEINRVAPFLAAHGIEPYKFIEVEP